MDTRESPLRVLVVDEDASQRALARVTLTQADIEVDEAASACAARWNVAARRPDVVVMDVDLPGFDALEFCREIKDDEESVVVIMLTDSGGSDIAARAAGADAFLRKPFSPLELVALVEGVAPIETSEGAAGENGLPRDQLLLYARDLRALLDIERRRRGLLSSAYRETVSALASALEWKDAGTGEHCQRVRRYALELAANAEPSLLDDPSVEYGFLLHDIGKIGIPDTVLQKPGELSPSERRQIERHTLLGEEILGGVALLKGQGLSIVRSHHERWDGRGYPDALLRDEIPLGARVFAVADALDAMTSDRPYRPALSWEDAMAEIVRESGGHFDPKVVKVLRSREPTLRRIHYEVYAE